MLAPDVLVGVEHVDVLGSGRVRLTCDRTGERRVLEQRVDAQYLSRLKVDPDLHGEQRVLLESLVGRWHGGER